MLCSANTKATVAPIPPCVHDTLARFLFVFGVSFSVSRFRSRFLVFDDESFRVFLLFSTKAVSRCLCSLSSPCLVLLCTRWSSTLVPVLVPVVSCFASFSSCFSAFVCSSCVLFWLALVLLCAFWSFGFLSSSSAALVCVFVPRPRFGLLFRILLLLFLPPC